jgi:hypothetical protein
VRPASLVIATDIHLGQSPLPELSPAPAVLARLDASEGGWIDEARPDRLAFYAGG